MHLYILNQEIIRKKTESLKSGSPSVVIRWRRPSSVRKGAFRIEWRLPECCAEPGTVIPLRGRFGGILLLRGYFRMAPSKFLRWQYSVLSSPSLLWAGCPILSLLGYGKDTPFSIVCNILWQKIFLWIVFCREEYLTIYHFIYIKKSI